MTTKVYIKRQVRVEIETIQPKLSKSRTDSFWYDGQVAIVKACGRELSIEARGEVQVAFKEGCKQYLNDNARDRAKTLKLTDKHISELYSTDMFRSSNWFTIHDLNQMGDIADAGTDYEDAIKTALNLLK